MAMLSSKARAHLPKTSFAIPSRVKTGPNGGKQTSGAYPIPDAAHARNALARVSQHGTPAQQAQVRAAVHRKFPSIGKK